ncbi:family 43 glycosylhydrolase [Streptomyces sp. NPDC021080]|uniref:family 43 glycosylhydrolase n=1 Tax=Streptomyces sp. NPDC021080 TaxID=3365110 RepID=UPI0037B31AFC
MSTTIADIPLGTGERSVNPFLPGNEFIPDGEPRVFGDRVYLYGSHDVAGSSTRMCAGDYVCWSAALDDLAHWRYDGVIYRRLQDPYVRSVADKRDPNGMVSGLFAPDVIRIDDAYYLYYGVGMSTSGFGVAKAASPTGPFAYVGRVRHPEADKPAGWRDDQDGIDDGDLAFGKGTGLFHRGRMSKEFPYDPALLHHDGRLFLYFGLGNCSVVELDPADKRTVVRNETTGEYVTPIFRASAIGPALALASGRRRRTAFMNGPSIREIDGRFWLSYWAVGGNSFCGMYHAVADHPLGPFEPVGPLVSLGNAWKNTPPEPTDRRGNTHGGMFEAGGTWYQVYHRHTADGRQACATPLTRAPHGGFEHAEYTSRGLDASDLDAFRAWPASIACHLVGPRGLPGRSRRPSIVLREDPRGTEDESGRHTLQVVGNTHRGGTIGFKYLDFGPDQVPHTLLVEIDARSTGRIQVYVDAPHTGTRIASVAVPESAVGAGWCTIEAETAPVAGSHALFMVFEPDRGQLGDLSLFAFRRREDDAE